MQRRQGWKLHVSATVESAQMVLARCIPVLRQERVCFKVPSSIDHLADLNEGNGGLSQVGKFITVYPNDDEQAVRIATSLDQATAGLPGPRVPSDRRLRRGGLVHYRYGVFDSLLTQTPLGRIVSMMRAPDGTLHPDERLTSYEPPEWLSDPFLAAGVAEDAEKELVVADRYVLIYPLHQSPRGEIYLAADTEAGRRCVVKTAHAHALVDRHGRDARVRLCWEAEVLERLAGDSAFPCLFDLVQTEDDSYLVMDDVEGRTLEAHVMDHIAAGTWLGARRVVRWGGELVAAIGRLHALGLVYRDLKSSNVIVRPDGRLAIVDLETAARLGDSKPPHAKGTPGYMSPQARRGALPSTADDVYGLGALLLFMVTGAEPSQAPDEGHLLDRPPQLLNPALGPELESLIRHCLAEDPDRRCPSVAAISQALRNVPTSGTQRAASVSTPPREDRDRDRSARFCRSLARTLCAVAEPAPGGAGLAWRCNHEAGHGLVSRDINAGSAGAVLALAELATLPDLDVDRVVEKGAQWLSTAPPLGNSVLPGLYIGEAGIGAALLRSGQILGRTVFVRSARERGRRIAEMEHHSPDLFNGSAGRLRFHLLLWDESGDSEQLDAARAAGDFLLSAGESAPSGGLRWRIPAGYDGLSGQANLGYAHGAAGIADALLDLYETTHDTALVEAIRGAACWLEEQAVETLPDASGLNWPVVEGESPSAAFWCHGAAGIGRFFLHAWERDTYPGALELAERAARTVAGTTRCAGPTQCHGLSGSIEFLLDVFQATQDEAYLREARALERLLHAFIVERDGFVVCSSETPRTISPDYMVGYAGVALALLRLSDPAIPHQLTRRGFRRSVERSVRP